MEETKDKPSISHLPMDNQNIESSEPLREILYSIKAWHVWFYLSLNDIRAKYRRAALGPLWLVLGMGLAMTAMSVAWSIIFKVTWREYIPYMIGGLLSWQLISQYISNSCEIFAGEFSGLIKSLPAPPAIHAFRFVMRGLWVYLHYAPFWLCVAFATDTWPTPLSFLYYLLALVLVVITAFGISIIFGMLGARFRDLTPAVTSLMMPAMMVTPVMWKAEMLGEYGIIAKINPLAHYLEVIRAPLLGEIPDDFSLLAVCCMTFVISVTALLVYKRYRRVLVFWV
ncbi:ABC transporter permease [Terasakiella pusilla]|uniref:ABC transporter permease n=1 Tax=Terasakiella pusilla TaxID=64973 RepID=UPI003AA836AC